MTDEVTRTDDGRWITPPKSPGRPVGPSRGERLATAIEPHIPEIMAKAIELAKMGDPQAQKLVLERYSSIAKQDSERVLIPNFADAPDLKSKAEAVLAAAASGLCSAEAAQKLLAVLDIYSRAVHATEMEERLQALEAGRTTARPVTIDVTGNILDHSDLA